jgi:hypothetical protein
VRRVGPSARHRVGGDREERRVVADRIVTAYSTEGRAAAWRLFLADANIPGLATRLRLFLLRSA